MSRKDLSLALLVVFVWGANFTVIKLGLQGVPPLVFAALRYSLAALPLFFVRRPDAGVSYWIFYGLTVGAGQFGCLFYAMHEGMPAGLASVVLQSQSFFTFGFGSLLLGEAVTVSQIAGLLTGAVGLFLVARGGAGSDVSTIPLPAVFLTILAAAFWGLSNIVVRKASKDAAARGGKLDMFSMVVWSSLVPPLPLLGLALTLDSPRIVFDALAGIDGTSIFAILYNAFAATILGFGLWSRLLAKYAANRVSPLSMLVPVSGLITASLVLGERLSPVQWAGCAVVAGGLAFAVFGQAKFRRG